ACFLYSASPRNFCTPADEKMPTSGATGRRSFPHIQIIPVAVACIETRVSMGCCLEYEGEWGQGLASFLSIVSVKPLPAERTTCPFYIRPHNVGTLAVRISE